jgi:beta-glucosidase
MLRNYPYKAEVRELLGKMTVDEKLAQLGSCWLYDLQTRGALDQAKIEIKLKNGLGQITRIGGAGGYLPTEAAKTANLIQKYLKSKTRLGIPAIMHEECCAGVMAPGCSIFPQPIGLASSFEPALAEKMTSAIRKQMMAIGSRQGLAPVLDVARDPRWGRIEETFGEDPILVSQFGVAYIRGLQSGNLKEGVMATGKHFVGHSFSQGGLNCGPVHIGWHDLWDTYLVPFQAAIRDAGLASMMNAYPELDGEVVAASKKILTDLLREKLGFDGVVVSDYEAVGMIHYYHNMAETMKEAGILALTAGIDVELPSTAAYGEPLKQAMENGELSLEVVDEAVTRHLRKKFELGLFDNPYLDEGKVLEVFDTREDRTLAYELACKSMVLLKNDGILPLKKDVKKIALIGPNANSARSLMGDYSYAAVAELLMVMSPEDSVFPAFTQESILPLTVKVPAIFEAFKAALPSAEIAWVKGCDSMSEDETGFTEAVSAVGAADISVLVMGGRSGLAPYCTTGEFRDATDLRLPGVQEKLVEAILKVGKPVVLVLVDGRPVSLGELEKKVNAILEAWVPGEEGASAIVDILFGTVNPSGKLPLSIPRSAGQVPLFYNYKPSGMRSNIYGDYVNEPVTPLYPFGFGLSYTKFEYSDLKLDRKTAQAGEEIAISVLVNNSGRVKGDEVVQLYLRDEYATLPRPVKELKGFTRLSLEPGEVKTVVFHLPVNMLAYHDADFVLQVEAGTVEVMVGSSSDDIRFSDSFEITGKKNTPIERRVFVCPVEIK